MVAMDLDEVLPEIGAFGPYQKWIYFLLCIPATLPSVFTLFSSIFVSATPRHWCRVPEMESLEGKYSSALLLRLSIPRRRDGDLESCLMYDLNYTALVHRALSEGKLPQPNESWATRACDNGWVYDTTYYDDTLVTQMNVVCDNAWKVSMAQCAFYIGSVVGNLLFGYIENFVLIDAFATSDILQSLQYRVKGPPFATVVKITSGHATFLVVTMRVISETRMICIRHPLRGRNASNFCLQRPFACLY
ncbi:hypothetical protein HPB50_022089 [Hyalomma asiaticum]|uniref:Uncharacterized protein n=1 Tax=Hyalomma asiaticum TaxID=266040 RepID=A0ACB7TP20_HYAAI|nr:hypothetical protein HPB50_022089 [Hyalomma asiaticum]